MSREQHIHELIDQYLNGELVGQDLDKFKIRLKDDPEFLAQVQIQKAIIQGIEKERNAELKAMLAERTKKSGFIIPFGTRSLSIAATILSLLAFGLIIKTLLPVGNEDSISSQEPTSKQEISKPAPVPDDSEIVGNGQGELFDSIPESGQMPQEVEPAIAVVAEDAEGTPDESNILLSEDSNSDFDLSKLRENEEQLDAKDLKAQHDSMLGVANVPMYAFAVTEVKPSAVEGKTVERDSDENSVLKRRKSKKEKSEEVDDIALSDSDESPTPVLSKQPTGSIRVEFWESIVNFKGYKFDGKKLLLFDTNQNTALEVVQYNGKTYLKKNQVFYLLIPNNSFNQLSKVTDTNILSILNK